MQPERALECDMSPSTVRGQCTASKLPRDDALHDIAQSWDIEYQSSRHADVLWSRTFG